ncbi:MAG: hypothetical protein ACRBN8_21370 [Nannocystales bacterium]
MGRLGTLFFGLLGTAGCAGPSAPEKPAPVQDTANVRASPDPIGPRGEPSPARAAAPATPYLERWVEDAREAEANSMTCWRLIYKDDCRLVRVGVVRLGVALRDDGSVESVKTQHNTITVDPELVATCLEEALAEWTFHPPEETAVFEMEFRFADRC